MTAPLTTVNYRIQNVDFSSYLEFTDYSLNPGLRRTFKANNLRQEWKFVDATRSGAYYIQSAQKPTLYLGIVSASLTAVVKGSAGIWDVTFESGSYIIYSTVGTVISHLQADVWGSAVGLNTINTGYDIQRWKLDPVTTPAPGVLPLPTGYYRIRTFNGMQLLTMPDGANVEDASVFVKTQIQKDLYQRWSITLQKNGLYTILSSGPKAHTYLACSEGNIAVGDNIVGLPAPYEWNIRQIGNGLAWSINVNESTIPLSLGFADYEASSGKNISLEPTDTAPSQIWFFENYVPLGDDEIHAKRQVAEGNYKLQSCHDKTIYMTAAASPNRITPGSTNTTTFNFKYTAADSPVFNFWWVPSSGNPVPVADCGGYLGFLPDPTPWVLLQENKDDPGLYFCKPNAGYPRKIISSRAVTDVNKNSLFAIDNMVEGDSMQMWKLVPA